MPASTELGVSPRTDRATPSQHGSCQFYIYLFYSYISGTYKLCVGPWRRNEANHSGIFCRLRRQRLPYRRPCPAVWWAPRAPYESRGTGEGHRPAAAAGRSRRPGKACPRPCRNCQARPVSRSASIFGHLEITRKNNSLKAWPRLAHELLSWSRDRDWPPFARRPVGIPETASPPQGGAAHGGATRETEPCRLQPPIRFAAR